MNGTIASDSHLKNTTNIFPLSAYWQNLNKKCADNVAKTFIYFLLHSNFFRSVFRNFLLPASFWNKMKLQIIRLSWEKRLFFGTVANTREKVSKSDAMQKVKTTCFYADYRVQRALNWIALCNPRHSNRHSNERKKWTASRWTCCCRCIDYGHMKHCWRVNHHSRLCSIVNT